MNKRLGSISIVSIALAGLGTIVSGLVLWGIQTVATNSADAKAQVQIVDQREQDHYLSLDQRLTRIEDNTNSIARVLGVPKK